VARDPVLFLGFWEVMTLIPAATILLAHGDAAARRAVFEYVAITHIGGVGVWVAVLVLADRGAFGDPAALAASGSGVATLVALAGLVGFGTKAGLVPLHSWLPRAHPLAPANVSALMSGVMVKVALYGLVRLMFDWLGGPALWMGAALLAVGALSALAGILYALFQTDLKRLLAFSTIENAGLIALGLGAAAIFEARGDVAWAALALGGALLHVLGHAVVKTLLFLAAGALERAGAGLHLDRMGGLLRRMPWTGGGLLVATLAIAGLPLLSGFPSEWVTLQALFGLAREDALGVALAGALGAIAVGATAALAVVCFTKVAGLALLGRPRAPGAAAAVEPPPPMRGAVVALGAGCVALGIAPGLLLPSLTALAPGGGGAPAGVGIDVAGTSLPTAGIAVSLCAVVALLAALRRRAPARRAPVWACGQPDDPRLAWTSAAVTKPLRLALRGVLRPERRVDVVVQSGVLHQVRHRGGVPHLFDSLLYAPVVRASLSGAAAARRLQSGSLRAYLAYLVGLVLLLLLLARTGVLG
jgi:hydrogenase-4 component B